MTGVYSRSYALHVLYLLLYLLSLSPFLSLSTTFFYLSPIIACVAKLFNSYYYIAFNKLFTTFSVIFCMKMPPHDHSFIIYYPVTINFATAQANENVQSIKYIILHSLAQGKSAKILLQNMEK